MSNNNLSLNEALQLIADAAKSKSVLRLEIEQFWQNSGYVVYEHKPSIRLNNAVWQRMFYAEKGPELFCIALSEKIGPGHKSEEDAIISYVFNGNIYSEEKMLRILELKAFL